MVDTRSPDQRRRIMQSVKQKDTGPEIAVRKKLHSLGYRFRLHGRTLPGRPDLVFPSRKKVIFVHGCFWHGHECSKGALPKSRLEYWKPKIDANKTRDERNVNELKKAGWESLVLWQCEVARLDEAIDSIERFLGPPGRQGSAD
ncbi:very short patch repair endonuclease [Rhizobium sp. CSW-27]|uniref:very short patch repair endonuclease n=1 Tax=Rhizobium sp. CSW-27 TaxID=2839985 RepID=UPI001C0261C3|nr:very short patch repair endonuclease [Rhizobium sp. CSW-27]MBT9368323.1 very short patch repair endonuclease [Rhizobium sp. CSW-27]